MSPPMVSPLSNPDTAPGGATAVAPTDLTRDEYAEAAFNERRIQSRYVEGIRNSFDPHARQEHAVRAFREALSLCRRDAERRRLLEEESLASALDGLGATRHRADGLTMAELRDQRTRSEKAVEHWSNTLQLIDSILAELEEHHGLYTETFVHQMELSTHEIKTAPWGHPVLNPWDYVASVTPKLLEDAAELPGAIISKNAFKMEPRGTWSVQEATRHLQLPSSTSASPLIVSKDGLRVVAPGAAVESATPAVVLSPGVSFSAATGAAPPVDGSTLLPPPLPPTSASPTRTPSAQGQRRGSVVPRPQSSQSQTASQPPPPPPPAAAVLSSPSVLEGGGGSAFADGFSFGSAATAVTAAMAFKNGKSSSSLGAAGGITIAPPPLRITCMATDDVDATVNEASAGSWDYVYLGASSGAVLGLPAARLKDPAYGGEAMATAAAAASSTSMTSPSNPAAAVGQQQPGKGSGRTTPPRAATPASPTRPSAGVTTAQQMANAKKGRKGLASAATHEAPNVGPYAHVPGLRVFSGHLYRVLALCAFTHKDVKYLASSSDDKTVRVYSVATKETVVLLADNRSCIPSLVYHRTLGRLLLAGYDGSVAVLEPRYGQRSFIVRPGSCLGAIQTVAVSENYPGTAKSAYVYLGFRSGHLFAVNPVEPGSRLNSATEATCVAAYIADRASLPQAPSEEAPHLLEQLEGSSSGSGRGLDGGMPFAVPADVICRGGHTASVTCIAAPHEPFVFSGDSSGRVAMWCTAKEHRHRVRQFYGHVDAISGICVTSDGFLITASLDATVIAWSWKDGALLTRYAPHYHKITAVLLGTLPKAKVDVASLIVSANNAMRGGAADRWPGNAALALRYLPGVVECTMLTASFDETVAVSAVVYDQSQQ